MLGPARRRGWRQAQKLPSEQQPCSPAGQAEGPGRACLCRQPISPSCTGPDDRVRRRNGPTAQRAFRSDFMLPAGDHVSWWPQWWEVGRTGPLFLGIDGLGDAVMESEHLVQAGHAHHGKRQQLHAGDVQPSATRDRTPVGDQQRPRAECIQERHSPQIADQPHDPSLKGCAQCLGRNGGGGTVDLAGDRHHHRSVAVSHTVRPKSGPPTPAGTADGSTAPLPPVTLSASVSGSEAGDSPGSDLPHPVLGERTGPERWRVDTPIGRTSRARFGDVFIPSPRDESHGLSCRGR